MAPAPAPLKVVTTDKFSVLGLPSERDVVPSAKKTTTSNGNTNDNSSVGGGGVGGGGDGGGGSGGKNKKKKAATTASSSAPPTSSPSPTRPWTDELEDDYQRILSVGEECISPSELKSLLLRKGRGSGGAGSDGGNDDDENVGFRLYDGFEPSGRMHIAQGVFKSINVNKCTSKDGTNGTFVFWVADWFALMNDKMGGDLDRIRTVGHYLQEVWKAAGMDLRNVRFRWASDEITKHASTYWPQLLDVARRFNITRIKKCCQIMGRLENVLTAAQILYPLMQCTDVFFLKADVCQLGVDQRKVNMLAREYCDASKRKHKPIILSHHMLYGLKAGQEKMSKSDPDSAIFMEDSADDVERKILRAHCPSQEQEDEEEKKQQQEQTEGGGATKEEDAGKESMHLTVDKLKNPCLDYVKHIIFTSSDRFEAGGRAYAKYDDVRADFTGGTLTETELKRGLIDALNRLLEPVRHHFIHNERAKNLLDQVRQFKKESVVAGSTTTTTTTIRRLNLVKLGMVPPRSHMVMAPLPSSAPTWQEAVDLLARLAPTTNKQRKKVLYLCDWTARVCNACGDADAKAIDAYYAVLLKAMKALDGCGSGGDGDGGVMSDVTVLRQSDAILADPSNYWISVMNVGRHFMLQDVTGNGANIRDADGVGNVIGRLMMVADVVGVNPETLALSKEDHDDDAPSSSSSQIEANLVREFYRHKLTTTTTTTTDNDDENRDLVCPTIEFRNGPSLRLQQSAVAAAAAGGAHKTENDEYFLLDDPKVCGRSKMKRAFCEPGNVSFCPPISFASAFTFGLTAHEEGGKGESQKESSPSAVLMIERSAENGGNVSYSSKRELEDDFASQRLHPGDLKSAVTSLFMERMGRVFNALKSDPDATKAMKTLKAKQKKKMT